MLLNLELKLISWLLVRATNRKNGIIFKYYFIYSLFLNEYFPFSNISAVFKTKYLNKKTLIILIIFEYFSFFRFVARANNQEINFYLIINARLYSALEIK